MSQVETKHARSDNARRGIEIYKQVVEPKLTVDDKGKYVAIDLDSGEFEVDKNDLVAIKRLRTRMPAAVMYLAREGFEGMAGRVGPP